MFPLSIGTEKTYSQSKLFVYLVSEKNRMLLRVTTYVVVCILFPIAYGLTPKEIHDKEMVINVYSLHFIQFWKKFGLFFCAPGDNQEHILVFLSTVMPHLIQLMCLCL